MPRRRSWPRICSRRPSTAPTRRCCSSRRARRSPTPSSADTQKARRGRASIVDGALAHSSAIVVADIESAIAVSNAYAPEHLILQIEHARQWLAYVEAAGSVFVGPWTPESLGDYCSGTNHVLPTYGYARRNSGLGVADFMRSMTVQEASASGLQAIGPTAETLAALEGLDAHAAAVSIRLGKIAEDDER